MLLDLFPEKKSIKNKKILTTLFNGEVIRFERIKPRTRSQRVSIRIKSDCSIRVSAPARLSDKELISLVYQKGAWIKKNVETFREQLKNTQVLNFEAGEKHPYMGEQYVLDVIIEPSCKETVRIQTNDTGSMVIMVTVKTTEGQRVKRLLSVWYKQRAADVFSQRIKDLLYRTPWVKFAPPLKIREMRSRWGSCSSRGIVTLSSMLVKEDMECIDYVILHELCHLAELNHGPRFYKLMDQAMPGWKSIRARLNKRVD